MYYEVETSSGNKGVVVYEVHEVYVYIPAELSAAGFELKISGTVRITDKVCTYPLVYTFVLSKWSCHTTVDSRGNVLSMIIRPSPNSILVSQAIPSYSPHIGPPARVVCLSNY